MKPGVRIVNCARGEIIVEEDLAAALQSGKVAGAALDVFCVEPLAADHPFRKLPNVVLTPHLGASNALGTPNYAGRNSCDSQAACTFVSLGSDGVITLRFTDNALTGSTAPTLIRAGSPP